MGEDELGEGGEGGTVVGFRSLGCGFCLCVMRFRHVVFYRVVPMKMLPKHISFTL